MSIVTLVVRTHLDGSERSILKAVPKFTFGRCSIHGFDKLLGSE